VTDRQSYRGGALPPPTRVKYAFARRRNDRCGHTLMPAANTGDSNTWRAANTRPQPPAGPQALAACLLAFKVALPGLPKVALLVRSRARCGTACSYAIQARAPTASARTVAAARGSS
jgi:hypothetical protein